MLTQLRCQLSFKEEEEEEEQEKQQEQKQEQEEQEEEEDDDDEQKTKTKTKTKTRKMKKKKNQNNKNTNKNKNRKNNTNKNIKRCQLRFTDHGLLVSALTRLLLSCHTGHQRLNYSPRGYIALASSTLTAASARVASLIQQMPCQRNPRMPKG